MRFVSYFKKIVATLGNLLTGPTRRDSMFREEKSYIIQGLLSKGTNSFDKRIKDSG